MSKAKKIILSIVSLISIFCVSFSMTVSASTVHKCLYQQPMVTEFSGYVEALGNDGNVVIGYFNYWFVNSTGDKSMTFDSLFPRVTLTMPTRDRLSLRIVCLPDSSYNGSIVTYCSYGNLFTANSGRNEPTTTSKSSNNTLNIDYFMYVYGGISSIRVYGNVNYSSIDNSYLNYTGDWTVVYGGDSAIYDAIKSQQAASSNLGQVISSNADKNASETQANDNKNTQAIIDNQNDLAEKEKTETQNQGEGSVNDVSGAIEDKSAGFISSIGNLVSAMSYNGTSCAWEFPALKLPAVDGVMSEIKLTDEKSIDFEYWVNKIPSHVLLLVRSVLTIALIGYCFKELYNTISYVLTLKGGVNDE